MIQFSTKLKLGFASLTALLALPSVAIAEPMTVTVNFTSTQGVGAAVGTISLEDTGYGLLLTPDLKGLASGMHGFHIHANPSCAPAEKDGAMVAGLAAGGHFDPLGTGYHDGPYGDGHLGDLPPLYVDKMGVANVPVLAPRVNLANVMDRSIMIHFYGDNFSDDPKPLGGGGARLACAVISSADS